MDSKWFRVNEHQCHGSHRIKGQRYRWSEHEVGRNHGGEYPVGHRHALAVDQEGDPREAQRGEDVAGTTQVSETPYVPATTQEHHHANQVDDADQPL